MTVYLIGPDLLVDVTSAESSTTNIKVIGDFGDNLLDPLFSYKTYVPE